MKVGKNPTVMVLPDEDIEDFLQDIEKRIYIQNLAVIRRSHKQKIAEEMDELLLVDENLEYAEEVIQEWLESIQQRLKPIVKVNNSIIDTN